jgi:hypothetical protein
LSLKLPNKDKMKKQLLTITCAFALSAASAQTVIDTVSLNATYANQVWYSLDNDNQGSAPKNNWDLAFDASSQGSAILINSANGVTLWLYPAADTSGWNSVDTAGITTWMKRWNSDTSWAMGAFSRYRSGSNSYDLDWGTYNPITHLVSADSLYIIKLANGGYKKLWIENLNGGVYTFRYANLDGSNLQNAVLNKTNYAGQNFGYYSLQNNTALTREPLSAGWDLLFTQYMAFIPAPYPVTGILQNKGVKVAEVRSVPNAATYASWSLHSYASAINTIGYDWKTYNSGYVIEDSLVYFVQSKAGDIWKLIPTGFGGSSNGNFIFSKEKLSSTAIEQAGAPLSAFAVYPNPCSDKTNLLIATGEITGAVKLTVKDLQGRILLTDELPALQPGELHTVRLPTASFQSGVYLVSVHCGVSVLTQRLVIAR